MCVVGTDRGLVQISAASDREPPERCCRAPAGGSLRPKGSPVASLILCRILVKGPHLLDFFSEAKNTSRQYVNAIDYHALSKIIDIFDADFPDKTESSRNCAA